MREGRDFAKAYIKIFLQAGFLGKANTRAHSWDASRDFLMTNLAGKTKMSTLRIFFLFFVQFLFFLFLNTRSRKNKRENFDILFRRGWGRIS